MDDTQPEVPERVLIARRASLKYQRSERGRLISSTYRKNKKKERAEYHRAYAKSVQGRAKILWSSARLRAKERGLYFSVSVTQIAKALEAGRCEVTGMAFSFEKPPAGCRVNPWAPALDRGDNSGGYEAENVRVVCNVYNMAKNDFPEHVIEALARAIFTKGLGEIKMTRITVEFDSEEEFEAFKTSGRKTRVRKAGEAEDGPATTQSPAPLMPPQQQTFSPAPAPATFTSLQFPGGAGAPTGDPVGASLVQRITARIDGAIASGQSAEAALNWFRGACGAEAAGATMDQIKTVFLPKMTVPGLENIAKLMGA